MNWIVAGYFYFKTYNLEIIKIYFRWFVNIFVQPREITLLPNKSMRINLSRAGRRSPDFVLFSGFVSSLKSLL